VAASALACVGQTAADDPDAPAANGDKKPGAADVPPAAGAGPEDPTRQFVTGPGLRRLTQAEYVNTVFDLLGVPVTADVPDELIVGGHSAIAGAQKSGYDDTNQYVELALDVAETAAPKLLTQTACKDDACFAKWGADFLQRAFRSVPAKAVADRYAAILASTSTTAGTTPQSRLTTFVAAVLASPDFLYRREIGTGPVAGDATMRALDAYEVSSRLSYLVWQSMPDAELAQAAAAGGLLQPAQRLAQVDRMLRDARVKKGLGGFVRDWMALFEDQLSKKSPDVLKGVGVDLPQSAAKSLSMYVDDVLGMPTAARFSDLIMSDTAYVNATLAPVLGLAIKPTTFQKVMVDTSQRRGILMQPQVLGTHTKESGVSPFPLGKFLYENLLCETIPPPPATFTPPTDTVNDTQTLRQKLEAMTANEPCSTCHQRIGPPGFAFLPFDPIGRYKNADARGKPYDTTGALALKGQTERVSFSSATDLAAKLAAQPAVQRCVARRMFRWSYGRYESDRDDAAVGALEKASVASGSAVADLLKQLVGAPEFAQVRVP
jgi:hypothetical protein